MHHLLTLVKKIFLFLLDVADFYKRAVSCTLAWWESMLYVLSIFLMLVMVLPEIFYLYNTWHKLH